MPLSSDVNQGELVVALIAGGVSALFHWAATQTSDREVSARKLRGQMMASFASGMVTAYGLSLQTLLVVSPLGVFCAAAVVGFAYGPGALLVAGRAAAKKFGLDDPPPAPPEPAPAAVAAPTPDPAPAPDLALPAMPLPEAQP